MKASVYKGFNNPFAKRLREMMKAGDHKQQRLAEAIGSNRQSVSQYMDGSILPRADKLVAMADYLGVSCDYLMGKAACKNLENEEIWRMIGLVEPAIEELKTLWRDAGFPSKLAMLNTVSVLLSIPEGINVLMLLSNYLFADFSVGYASDIDITIRKNGFTQMFFKLTSGNPVQIAKIPMETMRASILVSLLEAVPAMRNAWRDAWRGE